FNTPTTESRNTYGGHVEILKYTGYLTDNFTLSAQYGDLKNADGTRDPRNYRSGNCPWALDGRNYPGHPGDNGASIPLTNLGCFDPNALTSYDTKPADETDHRKAGRLDLEWKLGDHDLRFGYDGEKFTSTHIGTTITGGAYYRYYSYVSGKKVNGVTPPAGTTEYVRVRHDNTPSGSFEVDNTAAYLEDNWKLNDKWLLYVGLRDETFNNKNGEGKSFAKKDNLIAPRLGLSWDITGDSTNKLSATLGRYYIPIASNTNIRASAAELFTHDYYTFSGVDPATGAPITLGQKLGSTQVLENGVTPNPGSVVATSLKPMSQDELIVGFEHKFNQEWSGGVRGVLRKVNNGMDDTCWHGAFDNWAADKGYTNFDSGQLANCVVVNPGKSNSFNLDLQGDGKLSNVSIPAKYFNLPDYKRKYTALEFFFERAWDEKWFLQGSYTWAHSYGTSEGYVESNLQQSDAGISQSFDFPTLEHGDNGNLPNDRRHAFKLFGAYQVAPTWRLSANLLVQSGRPQSCFGIAPLESPDYGDPSNGSGGAGGYNASSFYCNVGGTHPVVINGTTYDAPNQVLRPRGTAGTTPWLYQFDVGVQWMPKISEGKLSFRADIFNVFNRHTPVRTNPFHEYRNADVPGGITIDPNYGQVDDYQQPRVLQLTARYDY
ncbi:MAG TPA: TonB-dependent receptor, partial [Rhodanobacter sp.]|nr:TonB-dependent receptor [Rhodanobacter sp.]